MYYSLIGDFNYLRLNSLNETSFIILKRIIGIIFLVIIGGRILIWLIFPIPYFICLPLLIKIIALIVSLIGGWFGYEISKFNLNYNVKSLNYKKISFFFC